MKISNILGQLNVLTANPSLVNVADEQKESICAHLLNALRVLVFSLASPPEMQFFILFPGPSERNEVLSGNPLRVQDDYLTAQPTHGRASATLGFGLAMAQVGEEITLGTVVKQTTKILGNIELPSFNRQTRFDSESAAMDYLTSHGYSEVGQSGTWSKESDKFGGKHTFRIIFRPSIDRWTLSVFSTK